MSVSEQSYMKVLAKQMGGKSSSCSFARSLQKCFTCALLEVTPLSLKLGLVFPVKIHFQVLKPLLVKFNTAFERLEQVTVLGPSAFCSFMVVLFLFT